MLSAVLFLRAWTLARLWADLARAVLPGSRARKGAEQLRAHIWNETQVFKRTQHLAPQRKTTKYPIALFNPPSHDGGYHNGYYCIPARGHRGRSSSATGDGRAPGVDWSAAILAAVNAVD